MMNKPTMRHTSHANDFVNTDSHAREKPLLAGQMKKDGHFAIFFWGGGGGMSVSLCNNNNNILSFSGDIEVK